MINIANRLYTAKTVRMLDERAIKDEGITGIALMERAGRKAFDVLLARWPQPEKITLFCGGGNNGGDGYIVAALAQKKGIPVELVQLVDEQKLKGDAYTAWRIARDAQVTMLAWDAYKSKGLNLREGVVVDALLGTGIRGDVRPSYHELIEGINQANVPVVALDIPSGLCSDTGTECGVAVRATITVTFVGMKVGLCTGRGPALVGDLVYDDLGIPETVYTSTQDRPTPLAAEQLDLAQLLKAFPQRERDAHKGRFGHVLVIGGDHGYGGAVAMAAEAALRVGAGLVSVATRPEHVSALLARRPELMVKGVASGQELEPHLSAPSVLVIGPGLGRSPWSEQMLQRAIMSGLPMVLDADALNILSEGRVGAAADLSRCVLTPHPGEASRLLGVSIADVQADRLAASHALAEKYAATVLLKGAGTLIAEPLINTEDTLQGLKPLKLCPYGNPGMASGGMGDVLAGIIGSLMAQGLGAPSAANLGACLHSVAADRVAAEFGEKGVLASDVFGPLRLLVNGL